MYKNGETGFWEHDFRVEGVPRYHVSYGAGKKTEAEPLHITAMAVFRAKQLPVIEAVRRGDVTWAELTQLRLRGEPYTNALVKAYAAEPWPFLEEAIETYLDGIDANPNRRLALARWRRRSSMGSSRGSNPASRASDGRFVSTRSCRRW
jgi:hypothetical protein